MWEKSMISLTLETCTWHCMPPQMQEYLQTKSVAMLEVLLRKEEIKYENYWQTETAKEQPGKATLFAYSEDSENERPCAWWYLMREALWKKVRTLYCRKRLQYGWQTTFSLLLLLVGKNLF